MAEMMSSRKGVVFTLISILVVTAFLLAVKSESYVTLEDKIPVVRARVFSADDYVASVNSIYLGRTLSACSHSSIAALLGYMNSSPAGRGRYFASPAELNARFKEVLLNSSINGQPVSSTEMSFIGQLRNLEDKSWSVHNIRSNFTKDMNKINVTFFQDNRTGPWHVGVTLTISYTVDAGIVSWNRTDVPIEVFVDIRGFEDPLYLVETYDTGLGHAAFSNTINATNFSIWNATALQEHIRMRTYKMDENASSFIMRFVNWTNHSSCCGIESVIYPPIPQWKDTQRNSYIDCAYFGGSCGAGSLYNITGITTGPYPFKLDFYHIIQFNVSNMTY